MRRWCIFWPSASNAPRRWASIRPPTAFPPPIPRAKQVQIARLRALAKDAKLNPDFAEQFLAFIVKEVIRHHEAIRAAR